MRKNRAGQWPIFKNRSFHLSLIKYTDSPKITRSMHIAMEDLKLDHIFIVIPQKANFKLDNKVDCIGIEQIFQEPLRETSST